MKLNKFSFMLLLLTAAFAFQSCLKEDEEYFDKTSSQRMKDAMQTAKDMLVSSENGWLLEMYPEGSQSYGGYAFTVRFDSAYVYARTELATSAALELSSTYKMTNDDGPVLSFDGYNTFLHYFATPTQSNYQALKGEFEFIIMKVEQNLITLRGKKTGNTMYLRRLTGEAEDYISEVNATNSCLILTGAKGTCGTGTLDLTMDLDYRQVTWTDADGEEQSMAYAVTDTGIRMYQPIEFGGKKVQNFEVIMDGTRGIISSLQCKDEGATDVTLTATFPEGWRAYNDFVGKYTLSLNNATYKLEVELVPTGNGSTYYLKGLNDLYYLTVNYNKSKGNINICSQLALDASDPTQYLKYGENNRYWGFTAWAAAQGYISFTTTVGMETTWNGDEENPVYTWKDNYVWKSYKVSSFYCYYYTSTSMSSTTRKTNSVEPFSKDLYIKGVNYYQLPYLETLVPLK